MPESTTEFRLLAARLVDQHEADRRSPPWARESRLEAALHPLAIPLVRPTRGRNRTCRRGSAAPRAAASA
eukprot:1055934-Pyramimonas_sp.AAC.1